jgi:CheY-like chemotaxis protein
VGNGDKALEALDSFRPDIVLADVVMPGPPGYDVCEAVRKQPGGAFTPVVLLTGTFEPFDRARADRVGATAVVTKPFDSHALAALVRDLLLKAAGERAAAPVEPPSAPAAELPFTPEAVPMPVEGTGSRESAAASFFSGEVSGDGGLYATSAIPYAEVSLALGQTETQALPVPPPLPPSVAAETLAADDEPLPPPPPFDTGPAGPAAAWEMADEPTVSVWEASALAEAPEVPPERPDEITQPLPPPPPLPIEFEEEPLALPAPVQASEPTEAIDIHSASTPTSIISASRETEPVPQPPLLLEEPQAPAEEPEQEPELLASVPAAIEPEPPLPQSEEAFPQQPELPPSPAEDVFAVEASYEEPAPVLPEPEAESEPEADAEEPVARDLDEDIAAFESTATGRAPHPAELEALAASSSLSDLIPPATPQQVPQRALTDEEIEKIARRVADLIGVRVIRDIAWEVVPELAERLVRQRLAEIERE